MNTIKNAAGQDVTIIMTEHVTVEVVPTENGLYTFADVARSFTASEKKFVLGQVKEVVRAIEDEAYTKEYFEEAVIAVQYVKENEESVTYKVETFDGLNSKKGLYEVEASKEDGHIEVKDLLTSHTW